MGYVPSGNILWRGREPSVDGDDVLGWTWGWKTYLLPYVLLNVEI